MPPIKNCARPNLQECCILRHTGFSFRKWVSLADRTIPRARKKIRKESSKTQCIEAGSPCRARSIRSPPGRAARCRQRRTTELLPQKKLADFISKGPSSLSFPPVKLAREKRG